MCMHCKEHPEECPDDCRCDMDVDGAGYTYEDEYGPCNACGEFLAKKYISDRELTEEEKELGRRLDN